MRPEKGNAGRRTDVQGEASGPIPGCCGRQMTQIRSGRSAGVAICVWRCSVCERFASTSRRYDGQVFWVGAMGRAIVAGIDDLIAHAYADAPQS
jgi:hypothetical protein